ncbi:MAG: proline racemase family protein [Gemmatimonadetes bacterium]|nr:proline racemase family protein [Gemmatimonadota bacterium]
MTELARRLADWSPPADWRRVVAVDAHTEGEPLRVILSGFPELRGESVLARRREARLEHDGVRRALMLEPRGHADMYGCIVMPPVTSDADLAVLFTHNEGFSTMCGHGIIGLTTVLLECGLMDVVEPVTPVGIDTPAGFVRATASVEKGRVSRVSFVNVPSFVERLDAEVDVEGVGSVRYDLAYGGAFYAYVEATDFDLRLMPNETPRLIDLGRRIKASVQSEAPPEHPEDPELGFLYGTIFVGAALEPGGHSRNVCVFADGEVDRSPTGTGVCGRLAIHYARDEIGLDEDIVVESILGTRFTGRVVGTGRVGEYAAIVPEVSGRAHVIGRNEIFIDPDDPLAEGFSLR